MLRCRRPFAVRPTCHVRTDSHRREPEVGLQEFRQIGTRKCRMVYERYWAHFAAAIHLYV
jgi:hypothetical protein